MAAAVTAPTCQHMEPGQRPQECGKPAVWVYDVHHWPIHFRCARHAPPERARGGWQRVEQVTT